MMNWNVKALKRVIGSTLLGSTMLVGFASVATAQNPYWYDRDNRQLKRHQKQEKRDLKLHQRLEREQFGNNADLRRHQKEEMRELKRHQKHEKRGYNWRDNDRRWRY